MRKDILLAFCLMLIAVMGVNAIAATSLDGFQDIDDGSTISCVSSANDFDDEFDVNLDDLDVVDLTYYPTDGDLVSDGSISPDNATAEDMIADESVSLDNVSVEDMIGDDSVGLDNATAEDMIGDDFANIVDLTADDLVNVDDKAVKNLISKDLSLSDSINTDVIAGIPAYRIEDLHIDSSEFVSSREVKIFGTSISERTIRFKILDYNGNAIHGVEVTFGVLHGVWKDSHWLSEYTTKTAYTDEEGYATFSFLVSPQEDIVTFWFAGLFDGYGNEHDHYSGWIKGWY